MSFEEQYFDVLKSIEGAIVRAYAAQPASKDHHAEKAVSGLIRTYNAALKGKKPPTLKLKPPEQAFYDDVKAALEAHMSGAALDDAHQHITLEEAVACLKRIRRSIEQMTNMHRLGGSKYLEFVRDYQKREG